MLTVVVWKWKPTPMAKVAYGPEHVHTMRRMVARHYSGPHRFVCVTDDASGLEDVETIPLWPDYGNLPNPHGGKNPSCYRRLKVFAADISSLLGDEFVSIDLDTVITGDLTPIFERDEDFTIWGDTNPTTHYNGGLFRLKAGTRTKVWEQFDPATSPRLSKAAGQFGSDQGWISYCLGPGEAKYSQADGVYSYRNDIACPRGARGLPDNARLVSFHGSHKPWAMHVQADNPWITRFYQ